MTEALDRRFLAAAIRLGAGGLGTAWPNPAVGAIVVSKGAVVGRARTARGGRPHAETQALAKAGEKARGATLYVSLEPCSHHGRTPPCANAIIGAGVARVVAPIADPDPRVAGKGFERLAAGVEVVQGRLAGEARCSHAGYLKRIEHQRPYVTLKLAVSSDDAIGRAGEAQVAVTGPIARRHAQALRSRFDAILVGRGTVEADNPALTCRLPGLEDRSPVRVVLDSEGTLGIGRRVFDDAAPTWVFGTGEEKDARAAARNRSRWIGAPRGVSGLDLDAVLNRLAEEGINSVLVEGGAEVARSFVEADLVDEIMLFRSPAALGGDRVPALAGFPLSEVERSPKFGRVERRRFGADVMSRYERVR